MKDLLLLWGKLGTGGAYHPALFHMLDVGHMAQTLLGSTAAPRFRMVMAGALNEEDPAMLKMSLPLLIALHDIGKISAPFQGQQRTSRTRIEQERLAAEGFTFGRTHGQSYPHAHIGAVFIEDVWPGLEVGLPHSLVVTLRDAIGGHHGRFAASGELNEAREYCAYDEPPAWSDLRTSAYHALREVLTPAWPSSVAAPRHAMTAAMALTGFTILCDWLGSDAEQFPIERPMPLSAYAALSRRRAYEAVERLGFAPARPVPMYQGFSNLFPDKGDARPLQNAVDNLPAEAIAWPSLFVIEAPTGEGKTEAALALAQRLAVAGPSDELYFGLPTTATSNQMFGRVHDFVSRSKGLGAPVKLIHGQAFLVEDDLLLRLHDDAADVDGASSVAAAPTWFAPKKRSLLAPFGVGTVDQVELGVLNARHYMLRLFGLAGKVVIIDEIHAYDTYMSTVLEQALRWLAALGSSVIMLSATLPTARHAALVRSFTSALPERFAGDGDAAQRSLPYPCIAAYTADHMHLLSPSAIQPERRLRVEFVADETPQEQAQRLLDLVSGGGAVCRLCNTVAEAQAIFRAVDEVVPPDVQCLLIHSRFPVEERQELERRITDRFGPDSQRRPEERAIVIGTQVLEQSLDLDFDALVTDLAPTDLLLQRAGRMHRHRRARPSAHATPLLRVQLRRAGDGMPEFGSWRYVYDEFILWMSWRVLKERTDDRGQIVLTLPHDYRPLIEATYPEVEPSFAEVHPYQAQLRAAYVRHHRAEAIEAGEARLRLVPMPSPTAGMTEGHNLSFEEDTDGGQQGWGIAKTRLGTDSITVIPLYRRGPALTLDPEGRKALAPICDRACQLRLLQRSIPVSHRRLVLKLRAVQAQAPRWFREAALLQYAAPLILDGGQARYDDILVSLDHRLGLVIGKDDEA